MTKVTVRNPDRGTTLGTAVRVADRWLARLRGLLGRPQLTPGEGLLLRPCRAVHMLGMRYAVDVAFVDGGGRVVAAYAALGPGRRTRYHREAAAALELPAGTLARTRTAPGDRLVWSGGAAEAA